MKGCYFDEMIQNDLYQCKSKAMYYAGVLGKHMESKLHVIRRNENS